MHDFFIFFSLLCLIYFGNYFEIKIDKAVAAERAHVEFMNGVQHFDRRSMNHAETEEKNPLPPMEGLWIF